MNEAKERPILMSAPMVNGILEDRKSVTRRIVKLRGHDGLQSSHADWRFCESHNDEFIWQHTEDIKRVITERCPYGMPGNRLWVRETWRAYSEKDTGYCAVKYAAGGDMEITSDIEIKNPPLPTDHWRPSIFMPRWASRITLEITGVRVERLHSISMSDAIAEGINPLFNAETVRRMPECHHDPMPWRNYLWHGMVGRTAITQKQSDAWLYQYSSYDDPVESYSSLWESINGEGSWAANPFVWCVSFQRI